MSILDTYVRDQLNEALFAADIASPVVLVTQTVTGTPFDPTLTDVQHACTGWRDSYSAAELVNTSVLFTDSKVYLLASSLDIEPRPGNSVTLANKSYTIIDVSLDAAGVAYIVQARGTQAGVTVPVGDSVDDDDWAAWGAAM